MPASVRRVLIIGGGIGGLAAAVALRRLGLEIEIYERAPVLGEVGAGLSIWRNGLRALELLGVLDRLEARGPLDFHGELRDTSGRVLITMGSPKSADEPPRPMGCLVHRADLHGALLESLDAETQPRLASRCVGVVPDAEGVTAWFDDGRSARGDLLIAADGLRSNVRAQLHGRKPPRYAGYTTWRGVTTFPHDQVVPGESWGPRARFGQSLISGGRVYWYATHNSPAAQPAPSGGYRNHLLSLFESWHAPIANLIRATEESAILSTDVYDRPPLKAPWGQGRVTLLGDAAHPMTPDLGQGACQALEDAVVLAAHLQSAVDPVAALRSYERHRAPRTARIVREARQLGRIGQWSHPWLIALRTRYLTSKLAARMQRSSLGWMLDSDFTRPPS